MKKKLIYIAIVFIFILGFSGKAFANITTSPPSPANFNDIITFNCGVGSGLVMFYSDTGLGVWASGGPICQNGSFTPSTQGGSAGNFIIVECDFSTTNSCAWGNLTDARNDATYISEISYTVLPLPPPPRTLENGGLFFDRYNGNNGATNLMAQAGTATKLTFSTLGPIVASILGIIMAYIAMAWIVNLINETDTTKKKKK